MTKDRGIWALLLLYLIMLAVVICAVFLGIIVHQLNDPHGLPVHFAPSAKATP